MYYQSSAHSGQKPTLAQPSIETPCSAFDLKEASERVRKTSTSQSDSVKRGRIRVIRTKLPDDFFAKPLPSRIGEVAMMFDIRKNPEKLDTPSFSRKQPQCQSSRVPATITKQEYLDSSPMESYDPDNLKAKQTANFFYFSSSQSTCDVEEASYQNGQSETELPGKLNLNRRNSKSKAEYSRPEQLQETPKNIRKAGAACGPRAQTIDIRRESIEKSQYKSNEYNLGCTFSNRITHSSAPMSPRQSPYHLKQIRKFDIFDNINKQQLPNTSRKMINSERPRLIRERFASKPSKNFKEAKLQEKMALNYWREPMVPGKKGLMLPSIHK